MPSQASRRPRRGSVWRAATTGSARWPAAPSSMTMSLSPPATASCPLLPHSGRRSLRAADRTPAGGKQEPRCWWHWAGLGLPQQAVRYGSHGFSCTDQPHLDLGGDPGSHQGRHRPGRSQASGSEPVRLLPRQGGLRCHGLRFPAGAAGTP